MAVGDVELDLEPLPYATPDAVGPAALDRSVRIVCAVLAVATSAAGAFMLAVLYWHSGGSLARQSWFAQSIDFAMLAHEPRGWWRSDWLGFVARGVAAWLRWTAILPLALAAWFGAVRGVAWPRRAAVVGAAILAASEGLIASQPILRLIGKVTTEWTDWWSVTRAVDDVCRTTALPALLVTMALTRREDVRRRWAGGMLVAIGTTWLLCSVRRLAVDRAVFDVLFAHMLMLPIARIEGSGGGSLGPVGDAASVSASAVTYSFALLGGVACIANFRAWRIAARGAAMCLAAWSGLSLLALFSLFVYHARTLWTDDYHIFGFEDRDGPFARLLTPLNRFCFSGLVLTISRSRADNSP